MLRDQTWNSVLELMIYVLFFVLLVWDIYNYVILTILYYYSCKNNELDKNVEMNSWCKTLTVFDETNFHTIRQSIPSRNKHQRDSISLRKDQQHIPSWKRMLQPLTWINSKDEPCYTTSPSTTPRRPALFASPTPDPNQFVEPFIDEFVTLHQQELLNAANSQRINPTFEDVPVFDSLAPHDSLHLFQTQSQDNSSTTPQAQQDEANVTWSTTTIVEEDNADYESQPPY